MSLDKIALVISIGDNGEGKRHGMCMEVIAEKEWGLPFEKIVTRNHRPAYMFVILKPEMLRVARRACEPTYYKTLDARGFQRLNLLHNSYVNFQELGQKLNLPNLAKELQFPTRSHAMIVDGTNLGSNIFYTYEETGSVQFAYDYYTISSGSYTVGASQNYATWALAGADLTTLIGDLTLTQNTATTETAICALSNALAGHALNLTSSLKHNGSFSGGYLISSNENQSSTGQFYITCTSASGGATVNLSDLIMKMGGTYTSFGAGIHTRTTSGIITNAWNILCNCNGKNIIVYNIGTTSGNASNGWNIIGINGAVGTSGYFTSGIALQGGGGIHFENCAFYNFTRTNGYCCGISNYNNDYMAVLKNMVCFGNYIDFAYGATNTPGLGATIATDCASQDLTGTTGLTGLTPLNEVVSVTSTDSTFMKPKFGGHLYNGGTTPSIGANTVGIEGHKRPHGSLYSIGAFEWKSPNSVPINYLQEV